MPPSENEVTATKVTSRHPYSAYDRGGSEPAFQEIHGDKVAVADDPFVAIGIALIRFNERLSDRKTSLV